MRLFRIPAKHASLADRLTMLAASWVGPTFGVMLIVFGKMLASAFGELFYRVASVGPWASLTLYFVLVAMLAIVVYAVIRRMFDIDIDNSTKGVMFEAIRLSPQDRFTHESQVEGLYAAPKHTGITPMSVFLDQRPSASGATPLPR